jgi:hypothetical protein
MARAHRKGSRTPDDRYALAPFEEHHKKRGDAINRKRNYRDADQHSSPVSLLRRISTLRVNYIVTAKILRDVSRQVDLAQRRVE